MAITAADVKALRDKTGAGMMECKKALTEANGDAAEAEKILKEKGLAAVAKRSERATSEGRIFIRQEGNKIVVAEVTCETDFVAKNADFIAVGNKIVDTVFAKGLKTLFLSLLQKSVRTWLSAAWKLSMFQLAMRLHSMFTQTSRQLLLL